MIYGKLFFIISRLKALGYSNDEIEEALENICFSREEFLEKMKKLDQDKIIIFHDMNFKAYIKKP